MGAVVRGVGKAIAALLELIGVLIVFGLLPVVWYGRRWRRIGKVMRRTARKIGAREGHLLAVETGRGVLGEGPDWRVITILRRGNADDIGARSCSGPCAPATSCHRRG